MKSMKLRIVVILFALFSSVLLYSGINEAAEPFTVRTFPCGDGKWETRTFIDEDMDGHYDHVIESPCVGSDYSNPITAYDRSTLPLLQREQFTNAKAELTDGELGQESDYTITFTDPETGEVIGVYKVVDGNHTMIFYGTLID